MRLQIMHMKKEKIIKQMFKCIEAEDWKQLKDLKREFNKVEYKTSSDKEYIISPLAVSSVVDNFEKFSNRQRAEYVTVFSDILSASIWHNADLYKTFSALLIKGVIDKNGAVRQRAVNASWWLRPFFKRDEKFLDMFREFVFDILSIIIESFYLLPENEVNKRHLDDLKPSVFKSANMLYFKVVPRGDSGYFSVTDMSDTPKDDSGYYTFQDFVDYYAKNNMPIPYKTPEEVKKEMRDFLKKYKIKIDTEELSQKIYEADIDDHHELFEEMFHSLAKVANEMNDREILDKGLELWGNMWNYLPHKELGDKRPFDLLTVEAMHEEFANRGLVKK